MNTTAKTSSLIFTIAISSVYCVSAMSCATNSSISSSSNSSPVMTSVDANNGNAASKGASIDISLGGPADTVRAFCRLLREKKYKQAMFLTNLRPAIEGLTDAEMNDFALDFDAIAGVIPAEVEINGEIISGDDATVTANLPSEPGQEKELQQIKLKKKNDVWIIQTVDADAEKKIKAEGKQYFYNLRMQSHEDDAKNSLEQIAKAQVVYSMQNNGEAADLATLVAAKLVDSDLTNSSSQGYAFSLTLSENKRRYTVTATPVEYGRSGRQSYILEIDEKGLPHVTGRDNGGKPLTPLVKQADPVK